MQVVATAGHKGHGKSSLVHALTQATTAGPGATWTAAWTALPSGRRLAFVDAPGDEQSVPDVLAGFGAASGRLSRQLIMHIGSAAVPVRLRPLGPDTARLTLNTRLPLHVGDRALLRDPQRRAVAGVSVLDVRPPPLTRRGAPLDPRV